MLENLFGFQKKKFRDFPDSRALHLATVDLSFDETVFTSTVKTIIKVRLIL
jgi:hypothetical protein